MGRGLDGFFIRLYAVRRASGVVSRVPRMGYVASRAVFKARGGALASHRFPVALARGKHLFPFRTEQLSPSAPMVLGPQGPGRVGRRRFFFTIEPPAQ